MPDRPGHFQRDRFTSAVISHAVWLYYRFPLSRRDVEELLSELRNPRLPRTVPRWAIKFGPLLFAGELRRPESALEGVARGRGISADERLAGLPLETGG